MEETTNTDYLMEKKIGYLIDMKVNKLKNELSEALNKITHMTEDITVLKNKVQRLNIGVSPQTKLAASPTGQSISQQPAQQPQQKDDFNQRTGEFTSEDVSIEKMFYFGNK